MFTICPIQFRVKISKDNKGFTTYNGSLLPEKHLVPKSSPRIHIAASETSDALQEQTVKHEQDRKGSQLNTVKDNDTHEEANDSDTFADPEEGQRIVVQEKDKPSHLTCTICDKTFSKRFGLNRHMRNLHPDISTSTQTKPTNNRVITVGGHFPCRICDDKFTKIRDLRLHLREHGDISCQRCYSIFPTELDRKEHEDEYQQVPGAIEYKCISFEGCKRTFNSVCGQRSHEYTHYRSIVCCICQTSFSKNNGLVRHIRNKHPDQENNIQIVSNGKPIKTRLLRHG